MPLDLGVDQGRDWAVVLNAVDEQAVQNAGSMGWSLSAEDMATLDSVALYGKRGIAQRIWQHG